MKWVLLIWTSELVAFNRHKGLDMKTYTRNILFEKVFLLKTEDSECLSLNTCQNLPDGPVEQRGSPVVHGLSTTIVTSLPSKQQCLPVSESKIDIAFLQPRKAVLCGISYIPRTVAFWSVNQDVMKLC